MNMRICCYDLVGMDSKTLVPFILLYFILYLIYVFFYLHKNPENLELALFSTLALVAAIPSFVLCLTLH
jgi:multisubunit Na+/H+ antiporter MnhB subunit